MTIIFWFLVLLSVAEIVLLSILARRVPLDLIGTAMHPFNVVGFLFAITIIDFVSLRDLVATTGAVPFAQWVIFTPNEVIDAFVFYFWCQSAIVFGIWLASFNARDRQAGPARLLGGPGDRAMPIESNTARLCMLLSVAASIFAGWAVVTTSLSAGSLTYVAGIRTRYFADNPELLIIAATSVPAIILFGSRTELKSALKWMVIPVLFLGLIGGRGRLIFPLAAAAYWFCLSHRLPLKWVYLGSPVLMIALTVYTYFVRETLLHGTFLDYLDASGGLFGTLFNEPSISMAEMITINVANPSLERAPWESLLGALLLPVPRAVFDGKPFGASTDFSMMTDISRWFLVKSEWTVTGFIDLFYSFGKTLTPGVLIAMTYPTVKYLQISARSRLGTAFSGPVVFVSFYLFLRGDLYIVSQFLWPTAMVVLIYIGLLKCLESTMLRSLRVRHGTGHRHSLSHPPYTTSKRTPKYRSRFQ